MNSVTFRLLVVVLAITILGMGLIAVIGTTIAGASLNEQSLGRVEEKTAYSAENIEAWLVRQIGYIDAIAVDFSTMPEITPEALFPALVIHAERNEDYFAVYAGYPDGIGVFNDEWEPDYNEWRANERDWYQGAAATPGRAYLTELYKDAETGNFCLTLAETFTHNSAMAGVVAIDIFTNVLGDVVNSVDAGRDSYSFLTDAQGQILVHHERDYEPTIDQNEDTVFQNLAEIENKKYAALRDPAVTNGGFIKLRSADGVNRFYTGSQIPSTGWILYTAIPVSVVNAPINNQIKAAAVVFVLVLCVAVVLIYYSVRKLIMVPVRDVTEAADLLATGELDVRLEGDYRGEIALLADSFRGMAEASREQADWLESIAGGDLSVAARPRSGNDRIGNAIVDMLAGLNGMFVDISQSTAQVADASKQIADGAQYLAQGSTQQAASIQELSSSITEVAERTKENAATAEKTSALSGTIKETAEKGSRQMNEMLEAVKEINEASQAISKIIKTIDDIAFQTNILALNAAVEAARAGQHGKGFAVVAEEVRNLASKSAEAARDTGDMIQNSMEKAALGSRIAEETAVSLNEIAYGVNESNQLLTEIAEASEEQSRAILQINLGIEQVAQVVQQNSATAQESAAASQEMSSQSTMLQGLIARLKLKEQHR